MTRRAAEGSSITLRGVPETPRVVMGWHAHAKHYGCWVVSSGGRAWFVGGSPEGFTVVTLFSGSLMVGDAKADDASGIDRCVTVGDWLLGRRRQGREKG